MKAAGFYKRTLSSPPAIEFSSYEGKKLFSEALHDGTMEGYFKLGSHFQTQSEPAYCGLATLSMVLNSLEIDPGRKWKGPWRWYDETMLDCCEPLNKIKNEGISLRNVTCLARCAGAKVVVFHTNQTTIDDFRTHVINCTSSEDIHLIVTYNRKAFNQTGSGHFSPIGGYHAGRDMALILDVARFKYPPHWIPLTLLWEAMNTIDEATGCYRGFMIVSKFQKAPFLLYTLSGEHKNITSTAKFLIDDVPLLLTSESLSTIPEVLSTIFRHLPMHAGDLIKWIAEVWRTEENECLSKMEKEEVLQQVRETELFKHVADWVSSGSRCCIGFPVSIDKDTSLGSEISKEYFCTSVCSKSNGNNHGTVVSSLVTINGSETLNGVDSLVPLSPDKSTSGFDSCSSTCTMKDLEINDVLTILIFALPPHTWQSIKKEGLRKEIHAAVLIEDFPHILQKEVINMRQQLRCMKKLTNNVSNV